MTDQLIVPPGKATGCLPRASEPGEWCPLARERIDIIPQGDWPEFLDGIDLRPHVNQIKDQGSVGSCATESTTQGVEIVRDLCGWPWELLNPWFVYYHTSGGQDRGSSIDENLRFVRERGVAPEAVWPRSKGWRAEPSEEAYEVAREYRILEFYDIQNIRELGSALLLGFPVVFGWQGHSCVFTSLVDPDTGEYANSWSPQWGDDGFGRLKLSLVNWYYGAFAVRLAKFSRDLLQSVATASAA